MHTTAQVPPVMVGPSPDDPPGCCVPGCSEAEAPGAFGVCHQHRRQELEAQASSDQAHDIELEVALCRLEAEAEDRAQAERIAELRRQRERETWAHDRQRHDRRVAGVLRAILRQFEDDIANGRDRNGALTGAAWAVGRLVAGGEVAEDRGRLELLDMARAVGLHEAEALGVIRRRFAAARKSPRILEHRQRAA
jgi:hypothetical protein